MKIIVLAGGLSPERDVSLTSGAGICRTLREKGHQAFLMDVFFGYPYDAADALAIAICHGRSATSLLNTERKFDPKKYDTR